MKQQRSFSGLVLALCVGVGLFGPVQAWAESDAAKLKALQQALQKPAEVDEFAPKAIVFDQNESAPAAPAGAAGAVGGKVDCSLLPPDTKTTAVDFEIQFKLGSADLSPTSEKTLNEIAKILSMAPDRCVFVEGHTDSTGNPERNLRLSRERADSVVQYIVNKSGIARARLITAGKGSTEPVKGLSPENAKNRRVSFKVAG